MDKNVWHWYFFKLLLVIEIAYLKHTHKGLVTNYGEVGLQNGMGDM